VGNVEAIPENLHELNLRGFAGGAETVLPIVTKMVAHIPELLAIIIDPTYKLMGSTRDENSAVDIASLMNEFDKLAVQTGASVISAAHFAKGNASVKEAIDRISGSGVFGRDPDSILIMSPLETDDAFSVDFILRCLPPKESIAIKWNTYCFEHDSSLDPKDLKKKGGRPPKYSPQDLLRILGNDSLIDKEWKDKCAEAGIKRDTYYDLKKILVPENRVYCSKLDDKWPLTASQYIKQNAEQSYEPAKP
jgi:hypothetical protein